MWQALNTLYVDLQQQVDTVGGVLKDADKRMAGGRAT
jgi:hypothetical protein